MYTPIAFIRQAQHAMAVLALAASSMACAAPPPTDITVVQVAPLTGVLASTGQQMVLGGKIYFDFGNFRRETEDCRLSFYHARTESRRS